MFEPVHRMQIVLIEDSPADVMLVDMALREAGLDASVQVIQDGEMAVTFVGGLNEDPTAQPVDLFLLDLNLPKCNGEDILKRLRASERHAQTPVIVMTSSDAPKDREKARKHAALHFRKPSDLSQYMQLGSIVRDLLGSQP